MQRSFYSHWDVTGKMLHGDFIGGWLEGDEIGLTIASNRIFPLLGLLVGIFHKEKVDAISTLDQSKIRNLCSRPPLWGHPT